MRSLGVVEPDPLADDPFGLEAIGQFLGVPCTTKVAEIATFLKKRSSSPRIVFTTYQSGRVLAKAAKKANKSFDLGIMDEAHKTVGRKLTRCLLTRS